MPYKTIKEDVDVECDEYTCEQCEDRECTYDGDVNDIEPNNKKLCPEYNCFLRPNGVYEFKFLGGLNNFILGYEDTIPFISYDPDCLRILYKKIKCPAQIKNHEHHALIQITEDSEKSMIFKPDTDGTVLVSLKIQEDLFQDLL